MGNALQNFLTWFVTDSKISIREFVNAKLSSSISEKKKAHLQAMKSLRLTTKKTVERALGVATEKAKSDVKGEPIAEEVGYKGTMEEEPPLSSSLPSLRRAEEAFAGASNPSVISLPVVRPKYAHLSKGELLYFW